MSGDHQLPDALREMVAEPLGIFWRILQPHFAKYEKIMNVVSPNDGFRLDLVRTLTLFMYDAINQANQIKYEQEERAHRLQWARDRKAETLQMREKIRAAYDAPGADKRPLHDFLIAAFLQDKAAEQSLEAAEIAKGRRGQRTKTADNDFVDGIAKLYERTTGKRPTVVTTDRDYTGPFVDLVAAVHQDFRHIFRQIDPKIASTLSANIRRYAKKVLALGRKR